MIKDTITIIIFTLFLVSIIMIIYYFFKTLKLAVSFLIKKKIEEEILYRLILLKDEVCLNCGCLSKLEICEYCNTNKRQTK